MTWDEPLADGAIDTFRHALAGWPEDRNDRNANGTLP